VTRGGDPEHPCAVSCGTEAAKHGLTHKDHTCDNSAKVVAEARFRAGCRSPDRGYASRFSHWWRSGLLCAVRRIYRIPSQTAYTDQINYYRTAFHELGHWTGNKSRLDRSLTTKFGTVDYAREELVAEMATAFVCASLGIVPTVRYADPTEKENPPSH
jgi:hypothetical protein